MDIEQIKALIEASPLFVAGTMRQEGMKLFYDMAEMDTFHCMAWITEAGFICEAAGGDSSLYTGAEFKAFLNGEA